MTEVDAETPVECAPTNDEERYAAMPSSYRLSLLLQFHWKQPGTILESLWRGCSPWQVARNRQLQRWIQIGGEHCSDRDYERFLNEMPVFDFIVLMLSSGSEGDEEEAAEQGGDEDEEYPVREATP